MEQGTTKFTNNAFFFLSSRVCVTHAMYMCSVLTFEGNDFTGWVHDSTVCRDGPADGSVGVGHVNNNDLGLVAHLLSDANELIRLHG